MRSEATDLGSGVLFNKQNWYGFVERRALAFRQEYENVPDDMALDEATAIMGEV